MNKGSRPMLIAHRGYSACYPENTLRGLRAALSAGADGIEFDVQFSKDGEPVVIHDKSLMRTAGVAKEVDELTANELTRISAGERARFVERFQRETIPVLTDVLYLLRSYPESKALVEIKAESIKAFGVEYVAKRMVAETKPYADQCVLISYERSVLEAARELGAKHIGWVMREWGKISLQTAQKLLPDILICNYKKIPDEEEVLWRGDWQWLLYDIVDPELAMRWFNRGAHFIETWDIGSMLQDERFSCRQDTPINK